MRKILKFECSSVNDADSTTDWIDASRSASSALAQRAGRARRSTRPAGIRDPTGFSIAPQSGTEQSTFPPGVTLDRPISADDAAAIAVWRNPQLQADLAALGIARADVIDAGLLRNPRLDMLFPIGAKPFEMLLTLPTEMIWQRPRRVTASEEAYDQLAQSLVQNGLNVARDARLAHADLVLAMTREKAAERVLELRKRIVELTNARLRVGDISELDAMAARNEQALADEQLVRARHDTAVAHERLRNVTGLALDRDAFSVAAGPIDLTPPPQPTDLVGRLSRHGLTCAQRNSRSQRLQRRADGSARDSWCSRGN